MGRLTSGLKGSKGLIFGVHICTMGVCFPVSFSMLVESSEREAPRYLDKNPSVRSGSEYVDDEEDLCAELSIKADDDFFERSSQGSNCDPSLLNLNPYPVTRLCQGTVNDMSGVDFPFLCSTTVV